MKQPKEILKSYFETGDKPTEQEFCDLIDSYHHLDSGLVVTNVREESNGDIVISLSDGKSITVEKPTNQVIQDNTVRVVNLGSVFSFGGDDEESIKQEFANQFNQLPESLRTVLETENIIIVGDIIQGE